MKHKTKRSISAHPALWAILAAVFAATLLLYKRLPEQMPLHWNVAGEVDRYGSRLEGAFLLPGMTALILLMMAWLPVLDPKRENYEKFQGFYKLFQWVFVLFMLGMQGLILAWGLGHQLKIDLFVKLGVGLLFLFLGNYMGKVRPNWFVGIKTPWTLSSEEVWIKTHRLAGPLLFGFGLVCLALAFVPRALSFWIIIGGSLVISLVPAAYSYLLYRRLDSSADSHHRSPGGSS